MERLDKFDKIGFEGHFKVSYFQIDGNQRMTPAALLSCMQEAAITHTDTLGYTLDYMAERQWGWSVINWHLKINRMPKHPEALTVRTWSDKCKKIQANRSFHLFDENGEKLIDGASRWIFMDFDKRKPTNVPDHMAEAYGANQEPAIEGEKFIMPKHVEGQMTTSRTFSITRRDTDTNGHANNVRYMEWAMDDVPDEIYNEMDLKDVRIVYRKECMRGDEITTQTYLKENENAVDVLTLIKSVDDVLLAEVATIWEKPKNFQQ